VFLIAVIIATGLGYYLITPAKKEAREEVFVVRVGATLNDVADELGKRELITRKPLFIAWVRFMGHGRDIKAGEYLLNACMAPLQIINILTKGVIITHPVTIPEGFTAKQIGAFLGKQGI